MVTLVLFALGGVVLLVPWMDWIVPQCWFHEITGLWCPGCGAAGALKALVQLDIATAWQANPLVVIVVPFVIYGLIWEITTAWGLPSPPEIRVRTGWLWALLIVLVLFWVLRNVPAWPFTLLAPH